MEEKNFAFPVRTTIMEESSFGYPYSVQMAMEDFDNIPHKKIREECLRKLNQNVSFDWLAQRIEAYCKIQDFKTAFMLLRVLPQSQYCEPKVLQIMVNTVNATINAGRNFENIKSALVILCGKLRFKKAIYSKDARDLFEKIIKKFYPSSVYGTYDDECRLISIVLFMISHFRDSYFIPLLEEEEIDGKDLSHLMEYVYVSRERILLEALRILVLRHLKNELT